MDVPQFVSLYILLKGRIFGLFPVFGDSESGCCKQSCTGFLCEHTILLLSGEHPGMGLLGYLVSICKQTLFTY